MCGPRRDDATSKLQAEQQARMREITDSDGEEDDGTPVGNQDIPIRKHMGGGLSLSVPEKPLTPSTAVRQEIEIFNERREELQNQGLLPKTPASIASSPETRGSILQSQKKLSIGPWQQEEIKRAMQRSNRLFEEAVKKHRIFKNFLKEHGETESAGLVRILHRDSSRGAAQPGVNKEGDGLRYSDLRVNNRDVCFCPKSHPSPTQYSLALAKLRTENCEISGLVEAAATCDAYDAYAGAVLEAANKIKEQFSEEQEVWSPWYRAAMNAAFEAMLLRNCMIKSYEQFNVPIDQTKVTRLRNDAEQKAVNTFASIENYRDLLNGNAAGYADELEKYTEELQKMQEKYEKYPDVSPAINLVEASQLREKMEQILNERAPTSPGSAGRFDLIHQGKLGILNDMSNPLSLATKNLVERFNAAADPIIEEIKEEQSEDSSDEGEMPTKCIIL